MRSIALSAFIVVAALAAGCNNSGSSGGSGAASSGGATSADCVNKMVSWNPGQGDSAKQLFQSMCDGLTADQRGCIVKAKSADDAKTCIPNKPLN
jgi:hypothetical protein